MAVLDPLNNVVAWVIMRIHAGLGSLFGASTGLAWGLSIAILVILIRLCLVPLFVKQVHAQRKMAQHAPHLQELRKKYKNDKQRLNEETMKFYKENGVNPLAGCLPMIPQMIVFFSLFSVLRFIADWKQGSPLKYGFTQSIVQSAQRAKIFGVHLGDKFLFSHPTPPLHVIIVIILTVAVSSTTTFMTVRQSAKRGLMQTGTVDPDNPMAQSQKYMQYIVPFFSLTGLYWQYGLVLYWVTTNLWTLGQQYFMFRNWEPIGTAAASATAAATATATTGAPVRTAQSSFRSGSSRPGSSGQASARPANGARNGTSTGRTSAQAAARIKAASAASGARTGTSSRPAATSARTAGAAKATPDTGQNGPEKRGLLRLGRAKAEPEPQDDVPTTKVVRQQPVRQAKSKRSGKR
ncbi:MAG: membrane protein insertase YidC [Streptosporangiaceae bacterium]